jgi:hypothetical protein
VGSQLELRCEFELEQPVGKPELVSFEQRFAEIRSQFQQRELTLALAPSRAGRIQSPGSG